MSRASISLFSFQTVLNCEWYFLSSSHCRDLGHLTLAHSPHPSRNLSAQYPDYKFSAFFSEVEDQIAEFASSLDEQNRLLHCQLERALGIISTTIGRLFPTEILSLALGRPSFGIASGDVLTSGGSRKFWWGGI